MKPFLPAILFIASLIFVPAVFAKGMDVSKSASFSSSDLNFSTGGTVYVRVNTDKEGSSHVLSVKDSGYSTINSVDLSRSGSNYTASFSAPSAEGYYSLEAKIEGIGVSVTSVKTIRVGSQSEANIKVRVSSEVKGEKSTGSIEGDKETEGTKNVEGIEGDQDNEDSGGTEGQRDIVLEDLEVAKEDGKGIFEAVFAAVESLLKFLGVS